MPGPDNASYSDMTFEEKVEHYAKHNLLAQSLHPIAYENKPGFRRFREEMGLPFAAKRHSGRQTWTIARRYTSLWPNGAGRRIG